LELGFSKKDLVGKEEHVGGSWTNVSFLCLLDVVENKYWEYNCKPFKEGNWKTFTNIVNVNFSNDVWWNWKQVRDKWNKMKKIYETKKKKTKVISAVALIGHDLIVLTTFFLVLPK
jgi:hypothetical protein